MNRILFIAFTLGLFLISWSEKYSSQKTSAETNSEINRIIAEFEHRLKNDVTHDNIGSLSAAIFVGDQIVWSKAFGEADNEKGIRADTSTVYRTASISKTITAYLMMLMIQQGTIKLDDTVEKFFPEILQVQHKGILDTSSITFRHLASHTSGLAQEPKLCDAASGPIEEWESKVLNSIPITDMNTAPGEKYTYSNIGYAILGLALSRVANNPYLELVDEMVFKPLKMNSSFFIIPKEDENHIAAGYRWHAFKGIVDAEKAKKEHSGRGYKVPNGGIYSTPNDLARFLMAQCGNSAVLSKKHLDMMQTIQTPESKEYGYGLGYYIRNNDKGIKMVEHDGGVAGYNAFMAFHPESKIGVVLMRNYDFGLTNILLEPRTLLSELVKEKTKNEKE